MIRRVLAYHEFTIGGKTGDIKPILTYIVTDHTNLVGSHFSAADPAT